MDYLVDTNILLRRVDRSHAMHQDAVTALRVLFSSGETRDIRVSGVRIPAIFLPISPGLEQG